MTEIVAKDEHLRAAIKDLVDSVGGSSASFENSLIEQMIYTSLKLLKDGHDAGQLKLINRSLKEMRYAYRVFNAYKGARRISIFGSARTPEDHADYKAASAFSSLMASHEWMCMTGAANGIMKAGLEGPSRESSFGLCISLPFEIPINTVIEGDPKLIVFRYFFTRKLMFISHSDAVAVYPGGFGTMDELFEVLTLIQTGKTNIVPVVLMEGENGCYWRNWERYVKEHLLANGWICPVDQNLYYIAKSHEDGVNHILTFYKRYHSSRYVKNTLVLRLLEEITDDQLEILNTRFKSLVQSGRIEKSGPLPEETDHLDLPRLVFQHTMVDFGSVRCLIDQINAF